MGPIHVRELVFGKISELDIRGSETAKEARIPPNLR